MWCGSDEDSRCEHHIVRKQRRRCYLFVFPVMDEDPKICPHMLSQLILPTPDARGGLPPWMRWERAGLVRWNSSRWRGQRVKYGRRSQRRNVAKRYRPATARGEQLGPQRGCANAPAHAKLQRTVAAGRRRSELAAYARSPVPRASPSPAGMFTTTLTAI